METSATVPRLERLPKYKVIFEHLEFGEMVKWERCFDFYVVAWLALRWFAFTDNAYHHGFGAARMYRRRSP